MIGADAIHLVFVSWLALGAIVFIALLFIAAPYGRHRRPGWGPLVGARVGWFIMEAPAALVIAWVFATSGEARTPVAMAFLALWEAHYIYRAFIAPLRMKPTAAPMPIVIVAMGFVFNVVNGFMQGEWLFNLAPKSAVIWLWDPRFIIGVGFFFAGMIINCKADAVLRTLRTPGESGYRIPRGGMYEYISCPNYFGEIVEWAGWALATWSLAGLAFAFWTMANLLPRALAHHHWYRAQFADYPSERKAIIPFLL